MDFLAALLLLCLACSNYLLHRDVMYPGFLQASLWFVVVSLFLFYRGTFVPVSDGVFFLLVAGVSLFSVGAFVGSHNHSPQVTRNYLLEGTLPSKRTTFVLMAVVMFGLVLYLSRARQLALSGPSNNAFINLRYAVSESAEGTEGFGAVAYFVPLAYVLAAITILKRYGHVRPTASRVLVGSTMLIGGAFGALSSGRGFLLPLIVMALAVPTVLRVSKPANAGIVLFVATVLVFVTGGLVLGKGGNLDSSLSENWSTMRESFLTYSVGGIPALNSYLDNRGAEIEMGLNSFRTILAVLRPLGFQTTVVPLVQPFVDVPMPTNVYTIYQPYIKDFGTLGGLSVLFLLGFLHAGLYRRATVRNPHAIYVFLFSLSMFPLVMQVFQDSYFSLLSTWVQYTAYAALFFGVLANDQYAVSTPNP